MAPFRVKKEDYLLTVISGHCCKPLIMTAELEVINKNEYNGFLLNYHMSVQSFNFSVRSTLLVMVIPNILISKV